MTVARGSWGGRTMRAVVIDSSGTWWRGTEAGDLDGYLVDYRAGGYAVARVVHASCSECGASTFDVVVDDEQGYAERSCASCAARVAMLDSVDVQEEADAGDAACPCGNETFEVAVGFAVRTGGDVRWVSTPTGRSTILRQRTCSTRSDPIDGHLRSRVIRSASASTSHGQVLP
jgi:hypothetical protein